MRLTSHDHRHQLINASRNMKQAVVPFAAEKIRVGRDYQAVCPELEPTEQRRPELIADRALLVWSPTAEISDAKCKLPTAAISNIGSYSHCPIRALIALYSNIFGELSKKITYQSAM